MLSQFVKRCHLTESSVTIRPRMEALEDKGIIKGSAVKRIKRYGQFGYELIKHAVHARA